MGVDYFHQWQYINKENGVQTKKINMENVKVGYKNLLDLCAEFGLNPDERRENTLDRSKFFILGKKIQAEKLLFSGDNETEIIEIGKILENLLSQVLVFPSYNPAWKNIIIKELQCTFEQLMLFYLCKELKIEGFVVLNGVVYKVEYDEDVVMAKAKSQIEEIKKQFDLLSD